jgi:hypothetical protein
MAHAFFLGIDTRAAVSDGPSPQPPDAVTLTLLEKEQEGDHPPTYRVDSIRHEDEAPDPADLADQIQSLVAGSPYIGRTSIIANRRDDYGEAVVEALQDRGLDPTRATLADSSEASSGAPDDAGVFVALDDALEVIADAYRNGHVEFEQHATENVSRLARGLQRMVEYFADVEEAAAAPDTADAPLRPSSIDPHVTSAALAAWLADERSFDPSQHLKEHPQTNTGR